LTTRCPSSTARQAVSLPRPGSRLADMRRSYIACSPPGSLYHLGAALERALEASMATSERRYLSDFANDHSTGAWPRASWTAPARRCSTSFRRAGVARRR
jgi:hypothetical protein